MPRQAGPPKGLTHSIRTLVDDATFTDIEACRAARKETQAEFTRQAIFFFILTKCLSNPTDSLMQPSEQEAHQ